MSEKITVTMPNGMTFEATTETLSKLMKDTSDGTHYMSASRGPISIKSMATPHLKNAILKTLEKEISNLRTQNTAQIASEVYKGVGLRNITLLAMVKEFNNRVDY